MREFLTLLILPAFLIGGTLEYFLPAGPAFAITMGLCAAAVLIYVRVTKEK